MYITCISIEKNVYNWLKQYLKRIQIFYTCIIHVKSFIIKQVKKQVTYVLSCIHILLYVILMILMCIHNFIAYIYIWYTNVEHMLYISYTYVIHILYVYYLDNNTMDQYRTTKYTLFDHSIVLHDTCCLHYTI